MRTLDFRKFLLNTAGLLGAVLALSAELATTASAESVVAIASDATLPHPAARLAGRTQPGRQITIAVTLPSRDPRAAAQFVARVGTRGDTLYHNYLTPAEYAARFGASETDYEAVVAWAREHGLTPGERFAGRSVLPLTGTAAAMGAALGVTFHDYIKPTGEAFYEADQTARLPAGIARIVSGVTGLTSYSHFRPLLRKLPQTAHTDGEGSGPGSAFSAADLRTAYDIKPQFLKPGTQILGVFEQGGYEPSDVTTYLTKMKIAAVPVTPRAVDHYTGVINDPDVELEAVLDIDMQLAVNPLAGRIVVYEDGTDSFQVALLDSLSAMATDHKVQTISISYGQDEALQGSAAIAAENTVLTQLAAQGQAVFVSAGDSGAYGDEPPGLNVADPASQPLVTAVGGTTLYTGAKESYFGEETWNDIGLGAGATGGGVSSVWAIPAYQTPYGASVAVTNGGSSTYRNVPDVASVANPLTGVAVYSAINGGWVTVGGTSVSAPLWAGMYSLANAASEGLGLGPLGFANPGIYSLAGGLQYFYPDFNDILDGTNGDPGIYGVAGFTAGYYYDNTTGWGTFNANNLALDLALLTINTGSTPPALPSIPTASSTADSITLTWRPAEGDKAFLVLIEVDNASRTPLPTTLVRTGNVTLTGLSPSTYYRIQVEPLSVGGVNRSGSAIFVRTKA
jgi:kumamolisin